jgi:hypothetical protein
MQLRLTSYPWQHHNRPLQNVRRVIEFGTVGPMSKHGDY